MYGPVLEINLHPRHNGMTTDPFRHSAKVVVEIEII